MREFPQLGIKLPPHFVGGMIPRPAHIQGQLGQGIESLDFRGQKAVYRVADTCLFAHDLYLTFVSALIGDPAAGDQISSDIVQPDGLTQPSQLFQRIVFHVLGSPLSSSAILAKRLQRRLAPLNRAARNAKPVPRRAYNRSRWLAKYR